MPNALIASSSPYLRQHADNPVDWVEWSQAALDRAAAEDKPLLISIGYAACHWCHVMAHESFENDAIAALMNEHFVCIKVDREERPDLDAIYMDACQLLTGQGGWPLHAFATPDGKPFWSGTYFPPEPRHGMHSWPAVLRTVAEAWSERRDELVAQGQRLAGELLGAAGLEPTPIPGPETLQQAVTTLAERFDSLNGGFGGAPKFPPSTALTLLLRHGGESMARYTLRSMASGGIFDQLAGGFARYSVDAAWTIPHFEKMLFDNALLAQRYAEAAAIDGDDGADLARIAERTADWMIAELGDADGGFASSFDADSDGAEGTYYVWTPAQLREALGDGADADAAIEWFGVTDAGNFEHGTSVLEDRGPQPAPEQRERIVGALLQARARRTPPARDGKRVVSWNALTIEALATTGVVLGRRDHLALAERCAALILDRACTPRGRLCRLIPLGTDSPDAGPAGVLDDHAHMLSALVALYEATFNPRWLSAARQLADVLIRDFGDTERGGFFAVAHDHETLAARRKEIDDNPIPSGQSSAAGALLRLASLTGEDELRKAAEGVLALAGPVAQRHPNAFAQYLVALGRYHAQPREVAVIGSGPAAAELVAVARAHAGPYAVIAAGDPDTPGVPLLAGRPLVDGRPAAYVCEHFTCAAPLTDPSALAAALSA